MRALEAVAAELGLGPDESRPAGRGARKIPVSVVRDRVARGRRGRLILVTGMTPTSHGEGKTVTAIGTAMALRAAGRTAVAVLRQPSLGPVFGVKGGAAGGGRATVEPSESINLGLTGDLHAVAAAHNLLSALLDNHLYHGNELRLDPARILWPWTVDMEDRALRHVVARAGGIKRDVQRDGRFVITAASEVTAVLGLAKDYADLKERLGRILVGFDTEGRPVRAHQLGAEGAMAALLRDALEPNLVQTVDGTAALVHGGPFGNIAHGTASRVAIELGLAVAEFCVVEAGFATDLGAEKFVDIVARQAGLSVSDGLLVTTVKGLRHQGGVAEEAVDRADEAAVGRGLANLGAHLDNLRALGVPPIVVLNRFPGDSEAEVAAVRSFAEAQGVPFTTSTVFRDGAAGAAEVAAALLRGPTRPTASRPIYADDATLEEALDTVARRIYGAGAVAFSDAARAEREELRRIGEDRGPICVAKTQLSLSDDPTQRGRPSGFTVQVKRLQRSAGAGFTVVYLGEIETMPGLPKHPLAEGMDLDPDGTIRGVT